MSYLGLGDAGVYARCPRCGVCTDLAAETNRNGQIFCSNCGRSTPMTDWAACGSRELTDASVSGAPIKASLSPLPRRVAPAIAAPAPATRPIHLSGPTLLLLGGVVGFFVAWQWRRRPAPAPTFSNTPRPLRYPPRYPDDPPTF